MYLVWAALKQSEKKSIESTMWNAAINSRPLDQLIVQISDYKLRNDIHKGVVMY